VGLQETSFALKLFGGIIIMVILFNKPFGVLSQFTPEAGHRALDEFGFPPNVYAAGRLDHDSEGALLLTDDGKLIKKLLDPKFEHPRTYLAQVDGQITQEAVNQLKKGVTIKGYRTKSCQAEIVAPPENLWERIPPIRYRANIPTSWVRLTLIEGKNRQVRHSTAAVGFPTLRLIRVQIGNISLGDLQPGEWRVVNEKVI
jgi:23S rRNA pseudouridine2457 synthase